MDLNIQKHVIYGTRKVGCIGKSGRVWDKMCQIWICCLVPRKPDLTSKKIHIQIPTYLEEARSLSTSSICGTYKNLIKNNLQLRNHSNKARKKEKPHQVKKHINNSQQPPDSCTKNPKDVPSQLELQHLHPDPTMPSHPELSQKQWRYRIQPLSP